jgi:alpha-D-xyloside xylohydrolase
MFTLYEDEGDNFNYEKGHFATIPISWNDRAGTLTIGERKGTFPGMLRNRTFRVVWVRKGKGTGLNDTRTADEILSYSGKAVVLRAKKENENEK